MSWVSTMGRKFIAAYTEGLVMTCPMHRAAALLAESDRAGDYQPDGQAPAAIGTSQHNVRASLRPEFAGLLDARSRH